MRYAGIHSRRSGGVGGFLESLARGRSGETREGLETLLYPAEGPVVGVVVEAQASPALGVARTSDGSFAIVDGEILHDDLESRTSEASARYALERLQRDGVEALASLDGGFGLVAWDARQEALLVARDRWGVVPVYVVETGDDVLFSSDVRTLLRGGVQRTLHRPAIDFFLANGFVPSPWTVIEGVRKLPPAHAFEKSPSGGARTRRYWTPTARPPSSPEPDEANASFRELFAGALRRRFSGDPRTGVLLSGGVDSRLIVAGLCRLLDVPGSSLDTFTFRYADYDGEWNENEPARETARHFGTVHHEIAYGPEDVSENLDWMLRAYGEPFSFGLHSSMLQDVAAASVGALLNGAGPDGWYPDPRNVQGLRYAALPAPLRAAARGSAAALRRLGSMSRPLWLWRLYAAAGELGYAMEPGILCVESGRPARCTGIVLSDELRSRLYTDPGWVEEGRRAADELFGSTAADFADEAPRDRITFLHRHFVNPEGTLHWNHWWGRAHGITVRFPYFDDALLAFASRLPRSGRDKDEVRAFAATLMPRDMAYAPKIPQTIPIRRWLRGPLREFLEDQLAPDRLAKQGFFEPREVQRLVKEHRKGGMAHEWKLWSLLTVTAWEDLASRGGL